MFDLESVIVNSAQVTIEFPEVPEATITIARISPEDLMAIREQCVIGKVLDQVTKVFEDKIDNDAFVKKYSDAVILGWDNLKVKHLKRLLLCNIPSDKLDDTVECTATNKYLLMSKSSKVDEFVSSTLQSVSLFNKDAVEEETKK